MKPPFASSHLRGAAFGAGALLAAAGLFAAVNSADSPRHTDLNIRVDNSAGEEAHVKAESYANIVKRVSPSVVTITVETKARNVSMDSDQTPFNDPFFRQFFGGRMPNLQTPPQNALGSGVIVSPDGYIVTNNHVVANAKDVTVALSDGREFKAHVVGRDPQTDVAVVKIDAHGLPAITFANSRDVQVGDRVLAIGNPFAIGETVTTGIVSATGRRADLGLTYEDFIQTDAAINPGNSGGALVDADGRLIGINTAILSRSGGFQGVGLAVPSDLVRSVADNLVEHGRVIRGYLGIEVQDLTPNLADSFGLSGRTGALVSDVRAGSPAAEAGLKSGDVVTAINGKPVRNASELSLAVAEAGPDIALSLQIQRNGNARSITVTTGSKPDSDSAQNSGSDADDDQGVLNGVGVSDLDASSRSELNLPDGLQGALVTQVAPDSAAARSGLKPGDVILEIDHHPVDSAKAAVSLCEEAHGKRTLVKLWSHGNAIYVVVDETGNTGDSSGGQ